MPIKLVNGNHQLKVDHTPGSALTAGDCVDLAGVLTIVSAHIGANSLGTVNWPNGGANYSAVKTNDTDVFAVGDDVFITAATARALTVGGDGKIGVCSKASANGDTRVEFVHET